MEISDHLTCLLRNLYAGQEAIVRIGHEALDWFQTAKGVHVKAVYWHPVDLTYMQSISCKMPGWMNHKLASRLQGEKYQQPQICRWHNTNGRKWRETKEPLDECEKGECIHTEETRREKDTCTPMFIAALFIIARIWKQSRCPSADEWIRKLWYIYTMEYNSAIKKNTFESVLMRWMKLEPIIQSEVSQKEKHQYSILTHIYGI